MGSPGWLTAVRVARVCPRTVRMFGNHVYSCMGGMARSPPLGSRLPRSAPGIVPRWRVRCSGVLARCRWPAVFSPALS
eukprot:904818-Prymnesium_polylepis.2